MKPMGARLWPRIELGSESGCWVWTGKRTLKGYGQLADSQTVMYAHRASYEYFVGRIPLGLQIDHLCRNVSCINPDHLEPVTNRENARRGLRAQQTHCIYGHLFDDANTRWYRGRRRCRACQLRRNQDRYPNVARAA